MRGRSPGATWELPKHGQFLDNGEVWTDWEVAASAGPVTASRQAFVTC